MKNVVMPSSEDLNAKFKFFLTMMFAAQHAHKRLLEASFKEQAETINLLHKSKYGSRVPEKYHKITKEEIQEMIKDMGWSEPQPSTSKRPLESVEESEEDRNAKKNQKKITKKKTKKARQSDSEKDSEEERNARKSKEKKKKKAKKDSESDSEEDSEEEQNARKTKEKKKNTKEKTKKQSYTGKRKHYSIRKCTLCNRTVANLRRHVIELHVQKNEKIPLARAEAIIQMSIHGEKVRGKDRIEKKAGERKEFCGRLKEICPLCERVQQYLSTHLRRYHKLDNKSSEYRTAMKVARPYEGVNREIEWDAQLHQKKKTRKK